MEQSSTTAATDPDRQTIQYFANGGATPMKDNIEIVPSVTGVPEDKRCATFAIRNEDHTLGNALRYIIMRNPDVDFCGYSVPHPSEAKIHLRIQSRGPPAIDVLRKGLDDLQSVFTTLLGKFDAAVIAGDYEKYPDVEMTIPSHTLVYHFRKAPNVEPLSQAESPLQCPASRSRKELPYFLERTKVGKNLPIYTDYRYNGQKVATIIRRVYGNIHALATHLRGHLPSKATLSIRPDLSQIKIKGNYHAHLKDHFTKMGF